MENCGDLWIVNGHPVDSGGIPQLSPQELHRFHNKYLRPSPDACWLWTAARFRSGYGAMAFAAKRAGKPTRLVRKAHRIAWTIANGPIPTGVQVLHTCDRPPCVNPAHLYLGDHRDNMRDRAAAGHYAPEYRTPWHRS